MIKKTINIFEDYYFDPDEKALGKGFLNFINKFKKKKIKKGAFGEVRRGINRNSNLIRAVKMVQKKYLKKNDETNLIGEVDILRNLV